MKKIPLFLIIFSLVVSPLQTVSANGLADKELMVAQLGAMADYLDRLLPQRSQTALTENELRKNINDGVEWIINSQEETGHFQYEYAPYEGRYNDDDNIVRQAGTLYALGETYRQQSVKDQELAAAIEKSIIYFTSLGTEAEEESGDFTCPIDPVGNLYCRLGAVSLALLGVLSYVDGSPEKLADHQAVIDDYLAFIMSAKKPGAGLRDKYKANVGWQSAESPFSNGEALLALVRYYQLDPDPEVKVLIDEMFVYLSGQEFDSGLYLWIMAALKDMNQLWPQEDYVTYTKEFTDWRVGRTAYRRGTDKNYCAYAEGVASAYSVLAGNINEAELNSLKEELDYWNKHNATLQIRRHNLFRLGSYDGVFKFSILNDPEQAHGGFLTSHSNEVQRIDFTQHCVSAYLQTLVDIEGQAL